MRTWTSLFWSAKVEDVLTNMERGPGPFVSSQHNEVPHWVAILEWWWRCFAAAWFYRYCWHSPCRLSYYQHFRCAVAPAGGA